MCCHSPTTRRPGTGPWSRIPTDPAAGLVEAAALFTAGALRIRVQETFTLETAAKAHDASQAGHVAGRFVIAID